MIKKRAQLDAKECWNTEALYENIEKWQQSFDTLTPSLTEGVLWPEILAFKGLIKEGADQLKKLFELTMSIEQKLLKLYTYAHLKHDEEITDPAYKKAYEQITSILHQLSKETSWIEPEILALPTETAQRYLQDPALATYQFYLEKIIRLKKHTLTEAGEELIALAAQALQTPYKTFNSLSDADFKFPMVEDSTGQKRPLSHGTYGLYLRDQDQTLRKNAFKTYHHHYLSYQNSINDLLSGQMQTHLFNAKARNYSSCLQAALFPKNVELDVYTSLIKSVNEGLPSLHRYMQLRKKILQVETLHLYDIYVPLTKSVDIKLCYQEAEQLVIESVAPLGKEYQSILEKGLKEQRWVDPYENENKRSGAYSSGCFGSFPYILMNFKGILRDVFTLAHEAGHSMHSYYSRTTQPYHYSDYSIFVAEVASTFNEDLLTRHLLKKYHRPQERIFLINQQIEDIRATLFRQTMFAEFELLLHKLVEANQPLTPQLLKEEYKKMNATYFGPAVVIDEEIAIEWARIPHFYYNFYVFQYATGISAALALAEKVHQGQPSDLDHYLNFLKGGSSDYPVQLLKKAGVDMSSTAPVKAAIKKFDQLLGELEELLKTC